MSARCRLLSYGSSSLHPMPGSALDRTAASSGPPQVKREPGWSLYSPRGQAGRLRPRVLRPGGRAASLQLARRDEQVLLTFLPHPLPCPRFPTCHPTNRSANLGSVTLSRPSSRSKTWLRPVLAKYCHPLKTRQSSNHSRRTLPRDLSPIPFALGCAGWIPSSPRT
jgi:hypothetical protein